MCFSGSSQSPLVSLSVTLRLSCVSSVLCSKVCMYNWSPPPYDRQPVVSRANHAAVDRQYTPAASIRRDICLRRWCCRRWCWLALAQGARPLCNLEAHEHALERLRVWPPSQGRLEARVLAPHRILQVMLRNRTNLL
ncbi:hypothetical protein F4780DRAFT_238715 [Xylariomycetidae sp. FL0641]|nr:hypothetical protein F4780DRAFT_238715 [Xylariomycetidae sp. FL0641]